MKFPTRFDIFGNAIKIKTVRNLKKDGDNLDGHWQPTKNLIEIHASLRGDNKWETLCHESIHALLDYTGHPELSKNEAFVDRMAQAAWQIIKTSK